LVGERIVLPITCCRTVGYFVSATTLSICTISPFIPIPDALLVAKTVLSSIVLRFYVKIVLRLTGLAV
jgi:hypothetical protein